QWLRVETGATAGGFDESGDGVLANAEDGRVFEGVVLVGADGIRSRTRAQLLADGDPLPNGYMGFRTIVPMHDVPAGIARDIVALWAGPGFHMVHYPLRHGALFNIVAVFPRSAPSHPRDTSSHPTHLHQL